MSPLTNCHRLDAEKNRAYRVEVRDPEIKIESVETKEGTQKNNKRCVWADWGGGKLCCITPLNKLGKTKVGKT